MKVHKIRCDKCRKNVELEWNGEHFLFPEDWFELFDYRTEKTEVHLCGYCIKDLFSKKVQEKLGV